MFSFFKRCAFRLLIGFLLIAAFIWARPILPFASYALPRARSPAWSSSCWWWRAGSWEVDQASARESGQRAARRRRAAPVTTEQEPQPSAGRSSSGAFRRAVGASRSGKAGHSLYDLPWHSHRRACSGKTTALINSGLKFPRNSAADGPPRGVGGTATATGGLPTKRCFRHRRPPYHAGLDATSDARLARVPALLTKCASGGRSTASC